MDYFNEKKTVSETMQRLYDRGLTTASGGNVSLRFKEGMLITASQTDKGNIKPEHIAFVGFSGEVEPGDLKISMESKMHAAIYKARLDVKAIVHAHPVFATSFAITDKEIRTDLSGESWAILGKPAFAPYALMGSEKLASEVANAASESQVILMKNHGVIALGKTLFEAYDRMEVLEAAAKMTVITQLIRGQQPLSAEARTEIDKLFE